jgi:hypothetical protein
MRGVGGLSAALMAVSPPAPAHRVAAPSDDHNPPRSPDPDRTRPCPAGGPERPALPRSGGLSARRVHGARPTPRHPPCQARAWGPTLPPAGTQGLAVAVLSQAR